jgi:hypothetical protein
MSRYELEYAQIITTAGGKMYLAKIFSTKSPKRPKVWVTLEDETFDLLHCVKVCSKSDGLEAIAEIEWELNFDELCD